MPLQKMAEGEIYVGAPSPCRAALACSRANCFQHGSFNQVPNPAPDQRALDVFPWFTWSPAYYHLCCPVLVSDRISMENYQAGWERTPLVPACLLSLHHFKKHMKIFLVPFFSFIPSTSRQHSQCNFHFLLNPVFATKPDIITWQSTGCIMANRTLLSQHSSF